MTDDLSEVPDPAPQEPFPPQEPSASQEPFPPQEPSAPPQPSPPQTRGARLRAAREAIGMSQSDLAARLRLSLRQIQALESDEESALPPAPFVRGFVRNYARAVGCDPAQFEIADAARTDARKPETPPPLLTPPKPQRQVLLESGRTSANRRWLVAAVVALSLGAVGGLLRMEHLKSAGELFSRNAPPALASLGNLVGDRSAAAPAAPEAAPAAAATGAVQDAGPQMASAGPAETAAPAAEPDHPDGASPVTVVPPANPAAPAAAASAAASPTARTIGMSTALAGPARRLELDFDADCWVEVRDENNQVLLSGVSRAGDHRDLEAHGPVRIVVGNAPATHLIWNGHPVDLAGYTKVTVARLTLDPSTDTP